MRLPDNPRGGAELALRVIALAALAWLAVGALGPAAPPGRVAVEVEAFPAALEQWVVAPPAETLHVTLRRELDGGVRDALVALRRAGTRVLWSDEGVEAVALELDRPADPAGGVVARLAGPGGGPVVVADSLGVVDSLPLGQGGAMVVRLPLVVGTVAVTRQTTTAGARAPGLPEFGRIAVMGHAAWEARFVVAALEERGWSVDAMLAVAPGVSVTQGRPLPLDLGRHAVAVVLDSVAGVSPGAVADFVRAGAGLVLVGGRALQAFPGLAPGTPGRGIRSSFLSFAALPQGGDPRLGLSALAVEPLAGLSFGAVELDRREGAAGAAAAAARRIGAGRVVYVGYRDTWRWRMEGTGGAAREHRDWWAAVVAAAAASTPPGSRDQRMGVSAAAISRTEPGAGWEAAPRAGIVAALGPAVALSSASSPRGNRVPLATLMLILMALMAEWASRRLRGLA
ncbi:MAG TPA: hypothetical protein VD793_07315 [Gemmatimonadales bacterium]|nr:hypothetical protein [Gemmatimonadales bacterium]